MAQAPTRRTPLRDCYEAPGVRPATVLADYGGPQREPGVTVRMGRRVLRAHNDLVSAVTGVPGQMRDDWRILRDPVQLRLLVRALVDESLMTTQRRKAFYRMLLWFALVAWGIAGVVVAVVRPEALNVYESVYQLFFYCLATTLFLPTPYELILPSARQHLGVLWTVLIAAVAKTLGAWLVLLVGDRANDALQRITEKRRVAAKVLRAMMRFTQKYGYFAVFFIFATPFMSDTAPLFLLAVMRMNKGLFLVVMFAAIVVRSLLFIFLGDLFMDLRDRVPLME